MVSNDYRELILFLMIYQTLNNFQHSTFNPTFLENPNHRLIWFPGWLKIDLFVRSNEERLRWRGIPLAELLMFHDSLWLGSLSCGHGGLTEGLCCVRGAWQGVTGGSDDGRALASHSLQSVTWHWHGALTWHGAQSHSESGDCRDWGPRLGHGCIEDRQQIVITMEFWILKLGNSISPC